MNIKIIDEKEQICTSVETFEITHLYGKQKQFQKHMVKIACWKRS